jgi:hypothetical protein
MSLTVTELRDELEAARRRRIDPYRTHLQFLIGLIGFCLAVIVGVLAALPKSEGSSFNLTIGGGGASAAGAAAAGVSGAALGGVLAWIALAALVATLSAFIVQVARGLRALHERNVTPPPVVDGRIVAALWVVAALPILPGAVAVAYCVRVGAALLSGAGAVQNLSSAFRALF